MLLLWSVHVLHITASHSWLFLFFSAFLNFRFILISDLLDTGSHPCRSRRCGFNMTPAFSLWVWRMMIRTSVVTAVPLALWVIHYLSNGVSRPDADRPGARGHAGLLVCTLCRRRMCCRLPMYLLSIESLSKHECVWWGSCRCWWHFFKSK